MSFQKQIAKMFIKLGLAESTRQNYMRYLQKLNGDKPLTSLQFLVDYKGVIKSIDGLDRSTSMKLGILSAIQTVLKNVEDSTLDTEKLYMRYSSAMDRHAQIRDGKNPNEKTKKQDANWMTFKEIEEKRDELEEKIDDMGMIERASVIGTNKLIRWLLLCLYTQSPPRRNNDYLYMRIVNANFDVADLKEEFNYYMVREKVFYFNVYKTAKIYSRQKVKVSKELAANIEKYMELNPYIDRDEPIQPMLISISGVPDNSNFITRQLNSALGKKVSSSMIRHIYLTDKYGDIKQEMDRVALDMGHSTGEQGRYIKNN